MDWKSVLGSIAPTLATALGGPLAGLAVEQLGKTLGLNANGALPTAKDVQAVLESSQLTSDQIAAIKQAEIALKVRMRELDIQEESLGLNDRANARDANVKGGVQKELFYLSLIILLGTLGTEVAVLFHGYPENIPELVVGRVLGLLDSVALMVLAYWYGSGPTPTPPK
jgi:hypothetical protein